MKQPKLTFCVPNLNKIDYLPACIDSIVAQDTDSWKCVVIDGYSTDGSWEYMQRFADDPRFELRQGIKQGMYADWNECLKYVDTEYFYFLTSDDTCSPSLVSTTTQFLDQYSDIEAAHFPFEFINETGEVIKTADEIVDYYYPIYQQHNSHLHRRYGIYEFMMHCVYRTIYSTITSLVFKSTIISKLKGFSTTCGPIADFDWTMRLVLHTDILYIPETLATWRIYKGQATQQSNVLKSLERVFQVGSENIEIFCNSEVSATLEKKINRKHLTSEFEQHYAACLYKETISKGLSLREIFQTCQKFPFYPVKKIINKISLNCLFAYQQREDMAAFLIDTYNLPTPTVLS